MVRSRELCDKGRWARGRSGLVGPDNAEVEAVQRLGFTLFEGSVGGLSSFVSTSRACERHA